MGYSLISTEIPFVETKWKEEVPLSNGELIVVERATVPGQRFYTLNGSSYFFEPEQTLRLPDGTLWNSLNLNPPMRMAEPTLVDHDGRSWLIVVAPHFWGDHMRLGCPVPNFMYLRSTPIGWTRIRPTDMPAGLEFNLLMRSKQKEATIDPTISIEMKRKIHAQWLADEQEKYKKRYFVTGDRRFSWMNSLSHLVTFSTYCDPNVSQCKQEAMAECDPSNLRITK
jgi:hypothetical protein